MKQIINKLIENGKKKNHFLLIPFQVSQFLFVFNKCDIKMNNLVAAFLFSFLANIYNIQKLLHFQFLLYK